MTIHPYYAGGIDPEKAERFIIFVAHDKATGRFSFAANGAVESEKNLGAVKTALNGPDPRAGR